MNLLTRALVLIAIIVGEAMGSNFHGPTALPVLLHNGYLADTYEVAAAKSAHLGLLSHQSHEESYKHHGVLSYHGHSTLPHVLHDGHIADTHEVTAAKAEHFAAVSKARAHGKHHSGQYDTGYDHESGGSESYNEYGTHSSYHGPIAKPVVLNDGHIADTHEVTAAKAEHFAAVSKARAHGRHYSNDHHSGQYDVENSQHSRASGAYSGHSAHASYHGPTAKPVVLPSGYLADTHEVAHAKLHHLNLLHSSHSSHNNL